MKLRPCLRKLILWSAASISVLLATGWIGSVWWLVTWPQRGTGYVALLHGNLIMGDMDNGFSITSAMFPIATRMSGRMSSSFLWNWGPNDRAVAFPLWAPLAITTSITAFAWRKEAIARRRANQHKCPACGYARAGLDPTAKCPECGTITATTI